VLRRILAPDSPVEVVAVVTQPDKPVGRHRALVPSLVKTLAAEHGLPVLQPVTSLSLRRPAFLDALRRLAPDLGIVAAYGRILRADLLTLPRLGHLNVHASILPRWRGAWPVGAALLAGDSTTGVSIMRLDEGMDTGPVLATRAEPIRPDDTTGTLEARLATLGADLLVATIPAYVSGGLVPSPQDDRAATYCHPVRRDDARLDWSRPAAYLERQVRAMQPEPGAFTYWLGRTLLVRQAGVARGPADTGPDAAGPRGTPGPTAEATAPSGTLSLAATGATAGPGVGEPGMVVPLGKKAAVVTADGLLVLEQVQLAGRNPTPIAAFRNGYRDFVGSRLE
jgi:methionyl-tRNA formyltransferase